MKLFLAKLRWWKFKWFYSWQNTLAFLFWCTLGTPLILAIVIVYVLHVLFQDFLDWISGKNPIVVQENPKIYSEDGQLFLQELRNSIKK